MSADATFLDVLQGRAAWCLAEGDNMQILPALTLLAEQEGLPVGVCLTDPPFDQRTSEGARRSRNADPIATTRERFIDFDGLPNMAWVSEALAASSRWVIAFCALEQLLEYKAVAGDDRWIRSGVWVKPDAAPQFTGDRPAQGAEGVAIMHPKGRKRWNGGGDRAVWTHCVEKQAQVIGHPTPKPIPLMLELVELFTDPEEIILDPFCGSGTTGVAAIRLGRRFIGIEKDPKYAAIARERLSAESQGLTLRDARAGQLSLLGGT